MIWNRIHVLTGAGRVAARCAPPSEPAAMMDGWVERRSDDDSWLIRHRENLFDLAEKTTRPSGFLKESASMIDFRPPS